MTSAEAWFSVALHPQKHKAYLDGKPWTATSIFTQLLNSECLPRKKTGETVDRRRNNESVKAVSPPPLPSDLCTSPIAVSTAVLGQSHKDNVRCTAVEEQPEAKEVQLSQPSSTSLLMISSGLRVQLHLPAHDLFWAEGPAPPPCS